VGLVHCRSGIRWTQSTADSALIAPIRAGDGPDLLLRPQQSQQLPASCVCTALQLSAFRATLFCFERPQLIISHSRISSSASTSNANNCPESQQFAPRQHTFKMSTAELATSYAALILADDGVEITVRSRPEVPGELRGAGLAMNDGKLTFNPGRQDPDHHQGRQRRRC
jgi:hypothetical protein